MRLLTIRRLILITGLLLLFNMDLMSQDVVYLRTNLFGNYWGRNGNATALDRTFGNDGWTRRYFETADINELFDPSHAVIFVDGSNMGTCDLIAFFNQYQTEFEKYVTNGGALFINMAASECFSNPVDLGFNGVTSIFKPSPDGFPDDAGHVAFNGPKTPALAMVFTGAHLSHNYIIGGDLSPILTSNAGNIILGEKLWGDGLVLFGGITLEWIGESEFWGPQPEINNLYDNILSYLYAHGTGGLCTDPPIVITQDITVALDANGQAIIQASQIDNGSSSACGDLSYAIDITDFTCLEVGTNTVTLTVVDVNGVSASAPSTVLIEDITPPAVITKNITVELNELGIALITPEDVHDSSSDACGIASMVLDVFEFGCADLGDNIVILSVTDNNSNVTSEEATVTVENEAPVILSMAVPTEPFNINEEVSVSATYEDINLTSATWFWDDGKSSDGVITTGNITGSHIYTGPGVYTVSLVIEDVCGLTAEESFDYIIIVDPNGGFVTGGGHYSSPKGAYFADEEITGKAQFAMVAKYKTEDCTPKGSTVFKLKEADIHFKSKSYDWLVVNKNIAMYQGTGKIKKDPRNYRFQVSVIDDGNGKDVEDKFRFQLWDIESGELIYDNQYDDKSNADAVNVIDKGAITIHHYTEYDDESNSEDSISEVIEDESDKNESGRLNTSPSANVSAEIYPNPVANIIHVKIGRDIADYNKSIKLSIVSLNGTVSIISQRENISGPTILEYDMSGLKKGIYYLLIEGENISRVTKFIKN